MKRKDAALVAELLIKYMSTLDMAAGYWKLEIDGRDRHKTAFITKYGDFEHFKLAFARSVAYLDDIIVLGKDFRGHLENLDKVLAHFRKYHLMLKPKKCNLFQSEVKFMEKIVSPEGIKINPENVETINKWTVPKN